MPELEFGLEKNWYVIRTAENYETKAVGWCHQLMKKTDEFQELQKIEEFKIPKDSDGHPIIPGYVFIKVNLIPKIYYLLPQVPLFGHWVGTRIKKLTVKDKKNVSPMGTNYPRPLTPEDLERMEKIMEMFSDKVVNEEILARNLIPGGFYEITDGAMKGGTCVFDRLDRENERIAHVKVLIFGQPVETTIGITDIGDRSAYDFE